MTSQERLDDGSVIEDLIVEVGGKEYCGRLRIKRIDRFKSAFEVDYGARHHRDNSLFPQGADEQIRVHARSELRRMVEEELKDEGAF